MSDHTTFDPYHAWLGIHPSEQPADFYRLLGVCRFESDGRVIHAAFNQRIAYINTFRGTELDAWAYQVTQELSSAQTVLLSPTMKASYDLALTTGRPEYVEPGQEQDTWVQPVDDTWQQSVEYNPVPIRTAPRRKSKRLDPQVAMIGQMVASLGGLLIGYLVLCGIKPEWDTFGLFHAPRAPEKPLKQERADAPKNRRNDPLPDPRPIREPKLSRQDNRDDLEQDLGAKQQPKVDVNPLPQPIVAPPPVVQFDVTPTVELPDRLVKASVQLATIASANFQIGIHNPEGNPHEFQVAAEDDATWIVFNGQTKVAKLKRNDAKVIFSWFDDVSPDFECLRNTMLTFSAGGQEESVVLRMPYTANAPTMDLEKDTFAVPLDLQLWGLDPKKLQLEVEGTKDGLPVQRFDPPTRNAGLNQKVRAIMRDQAPYAAFDLSLTSTGNDFAVKIWPLMAGEDNNTLPWTVKRVNTLNRTLTNKITKGQAVINAAPQTMQSLQSQISQLNRVPANSPLYPAAQTDIATAQSSLLHAQSALVEATAGLPIWRQTLQKLKTLADLGNQVIGKLKIRIRIYFIVGGRQVDLYVAD